MMQTQSKQLWPLAALPLLACTSSSEIGTSAQPLTAECAEEDTALPEDAWVCPEPLEVECEADGRVAVETVYVVAADEGALVSCGPELAVSNQGPFAVGEHLVNVTAATDAGVAPVCSAELRVVDTQAPVLTPRETAMLWPPNHKMKRVTADDCFEVSDCDPDVTLRVIEVTSDEPFNAAGDGNHQPDVVFDGCDAVQLRAERQGPGDGRVYTLTVEATDSEGHVSEDTCTVGVPHDRSGRAPVDSGVAESVMLPMGC